MDVSNFARDRNSHPGGLCWKRLMGLVRVGVGAAHGGRPLRGKGGAEGFNEKQSRLAGTVDYVLASVETDVQNCFTSAKASPINASALQLVAHILRFI